MEEIRFKQSRNWWTGKDLDWIINNASFAFTDDGHKGNRPKIVTKESIQPYDTNCFEIDNDRYGIMVVSESRFIGETESLKVRNDVPECISEFLIGWGADAFVNPKHSTLKSIPNFFRRRKDKIISVNVEISICGFCKIA